MVLVLCLGILKNDGKTFTTLARKKDFNNGIVMCMIQDRAGVYWSNAWRWE